MQRSTFSLCVLLAGCATGSPAARPASDSDSTSYAIQQAYADTAEQARIAAFLTEYRSAATGLQRSANYLGEIDLLRTLEGRYGGSAAVHDMASQLIGTDLSFLGRHHDALELFEAIGDPPADTSDGRRILTYDVLDAVDEIAAVAATAQVVFVNEAHHVAQHRALTLALLPRLRALGYTHFAAESLAEADSLLNSRGYPIHESGFYTNEPLFGEVVRTAARLGYTLVPYEGVGATSQDARERGQALNLRERILRDDPDARVLVHAGYAHIDEGGTLAGAPPMAVRFRELTGIDPVTVDQTTMTEAGDSLYEHAAYRRIAESGRVTAPAVLRKPDGTLWSARPGIHDITVVHARTRLRRGRPDWLWSAGERFAFDLPADVCGPARQCVVCARLAHESADAVPVDRLLVDRGSEPPPLLLYPGEYMLTVTDSAGATHSARRIVVTTAAPDGPEMSRAVALTFDDLPAVSPVRTDLAYQRAITDGILSALLRADAPAIGFVNENKLVSGDVVDTARVALLRRWRDAGLDLGNHTWSHPDLHTTPLADYRRDILRGERVTRALLAEHGRAPGWFRHPFLHTGRSVAVRDSLITFLHEHGYRVAPVTVDNYDYVFANAYDRALAAADSALAKRIATGYVAYLDTVFGFYEGQSRAIVGREIPQVLLLHANMLNATALDDLVAMLRGRGYRFIDIVTALRDPAYEHADTYAGPAGITWLHRWAITADMDRRIFAGEPPVPDWIERAAR